MELKVFFFSIKEAKTKKQVLVQTVKTHFLKKEKIHIIVPDKMTLDFVDELLWNYPAEGFLPHSTEVMLPYQDLIFISLPLTSFEEFPIVFNLCQVAHAPSPGTKVLYELEDLTHPQKALLFQTKFQLYQSKGFTLCNAQIQ